MSSINTAWPIKRIVLLIVGGLCMLSSLIALVYGSINAGTFMPASVSLPLLLVGIFYHQFQHFSTHGFGRVVKYTLIIGYSVFLVSFFIISILVFRASHRKNIVPSDAIIVLGAGLNGEDVSVILANRLDRAIQYYDEHPSCVIVVSGGQGEHELRPEADAMADYLIAHGIPTNKILREDQSRNTRENFKFSKEKLDQYFKNQPYTTTFITSGFHVWRSELIAKKNGLVTQGIGSKFDWLLAPYYYLREYVAIVHHWVTGNI